MVCPDCHAWIATGALACPRCGARFDDSQPGVAGAACVVEGTAERGPVSAELPLPTDGDAASADTRLVLRGASLPAVLWRQPAVRAVAQAGAGAIALTLGVRLLRAWLAHPRAVRSVASSALPVFADLLQAAEEPRGAVPGRERSAEVTETVIYMRRVVRRR